MMLIELIVGAIILLFILSIPVGVILSVIESIIIIKCHDLYMHYRFRGGSCWGMPPCDHPDCRLRRFCPMYRHAITPEVLAELDHLLEERRRELEAEGEG